MRLPAFRYAALNPYTPVRRLATKPPNLFVRRTQPGSAPACFHVWR
jgi:hypothetical protein